MGGMNGMNRTTLRTLYVVAVSVQCLCIGVVAYYAFFRSGRGPWGLYLLASLAIRFFSRSAYIALKTPISN